MKGLNKLVLATAIAAVSAGAQAELKSLDDTAMGNLTGQAGITIDLDATVSVAEIAYKDEGFVAIKDFAIGGSNLGVAGATTNTSLDNIRIEIDVAGAGEQFNYGTSKIQEYGVANLLLRNAQAGGTLIGASTAADVQAALVDVATNGAGASAASQNIYSQMDASWLAAMSTADSKKTYGDGDLVIHVTATEIVDDPNVLVGDFATAEADMIDAVDFGMSVGSVSLEGENYIDSATGQHTGTSGNSTTLVSNISMAGYVGPVDIVITNQGNFADNTVVGDNASTVDVNAYFKVTNMDMDVDVMGVNVRGLKINNSRGSVNGLDGTDSLGFAHAQMNIAATQNSINDGVTLDGTGAVVYGKTDGLSIGMKFAGDVDVASITFGDSAASIGSIYMTDIVVDATMKVSAH